MHFLAVDEFQSMSFFRVICQNIVFEQKLQICLVLSVTERSEAITMSNVSERTSFWTGVYSSKTVEESLVALLQALIKAYTYDLL